MPDGAERSWPAASGLRGIAELEAEIAALIAERDWFAEERDAAITLQFRLMQERDAALAECRRLAEERDRLVAEVAAARAER